MLLVLEITTSMKWSWRWSRNFVKKKFVKTNNKHDQFHEKTYLNLDQDLIAENDKKYTFDDITIWSSIATFETTFKAQMQDTCLWSWTKLNKWKKSSSLHFDSFFHFLIQTFLTQRWKDFVKQFFLHMLCYEVVSNGLTFKSGFCEKISPTSLRATTIYYDLLLNLNSNEGRKNSSSS